MVAMAVRVVAVVIKMLIQGAVKHQDQAVMTMVAV